MANTEEKPALKITLEDLAKVNVSQEPTRPGAAAGTARQYGNIATPAQDAAVVPDEGKSKFYMQGWFYLGVAGLLGALIGWAIGEPFFTPVEQGRSANHFLPFFVI